MEYPKVKEWLDNLVRIHEETRKDYSLTNDTKAFFTVTSIIINGQFEEIADVMSLEIEEEEKEEGAFYYRYVFYYNGVSFVTYRNERMKRFA